MSQQVLVLGAEVAAMQRVLPILQRAEFAVRHLGHAGEALAALTAEPFALVIARFPLAGASLDELLAALRAPGSPSRSAGMLLVAEPDREREVGHYLGHGVNRIVSVDSPSERFLHAVADLVAVPPRRSVRIVVQLESRVKHGTTRVLTQTRNVSLAGMLIRGGQEFPIGARLTFELTLPGDLAQVRGEGEVVRRVVTDAGEASAIGVKFLSFSGQDLGRLETFLGANRD